MAALRNTVVPTLIFFFFNAFFKTYSFLIRRIKGQAVLIRTKPDTNDNKTTSWSLEDQVQVQVQI